MKPPIPLELEGSDGIFCVSESCNIELLLHKFRVLKKSLSPVRLSSKTSASTYSTVGNPHSVIGFVEQKAPLIEVLSNADFSYADEEEYDQFDITEGGLN